MGGIGMIRVALWAILGAPWSIMEHGQGILEVSWGVLGEHWGDLGGLLAGYWDIVEASRGIWGVLRHLRSFSGPTRRADETIKKEIMSNMRVWEGHGHRRTISID